MKCPFCSSEDTKVVDSRTMIEWLYKREEESVIIALKDLVLMKDLKKVKYMW